MDLINLTQSISATHLRNQRNDDLLVDRLCYRYSVVVLTVFAVLVTTKAYVGDPIGKTEKILLNTLFKSQWITKINFKRLLVATGIQGILREIRRDVVLREWHLLHIRESARYTGGSQRALLESNPILPMDTVHPPPSSVYKLDITI